jgi:shikimate dehydrogenase
LTLPHNEETSDLMDILSSEAQITGAVNVVKATLGKLQGFNTDVIGVIETLREQKFNIKKSNALIFGAGGAALSAGFALGKNSAKQVWVVNRTFSRARKVASRLSAHFPKTFFEPRSLTQVKEISDSIDLYINATPLGMKGFPKVTLLPDRVSPGALAFDLVYRPEKTKFLEKASKLGLRTVAGLDMLIWQAIAGWEIWLGTVPNRSQLKNALKTHLEKKLISDEK